MILYSLIIFMNDLNLSELIQKSLMPRRDCSKPVIIFIPEDLMKSYGMVKIMKIGICQMVPILLFF